MSRSQHILARLLLPLRGLVVDLKEKPWYSLLSTQLFKIKICLSSPFKLIIRGFSFSFLSWTVGGRGKYWFVFFLFFLYPLAVSTIEQRWKHSSRKGQLSLVHLPSDLFLSWWLSSGVGYSLGIMAGGSLQCTFHSSIAVKWWTKAWNPLNLREKCWKHWETYSEESGSLYFQEK